MLQGEITVAIDIGGTFTDIVATRGEQVVGQQKVLSTPQDYSLAIRDGLQVLLKRYGISSGDVGLVIHATTIATNAILEAKGARTALLTTEGFRDVLEIRRLRTPDLYNLNFEKPEALVPRHLRLEVKERMNHAGAVLVPLDQAQLGTTLQALKQRDVQSLAICFLHSYANPSHEKLAAEMAREILGANIHITASHEILPEIREYERTSTTVINAYVAPVVVRYLQQLRDVLTDLGIDSPLRIMQSNGGVLGLEAVLKSPASIVESGPAAGVVGGSNISRYLKPPNAITIDMGGTTAKASLIEQGQVIKTSEYEVGAGINVSSQLVKGRGHALRLPVIDVSEIGAGGGSLARVDNFGRLLVGPHSAGASPGPVCYGRGGDQVTLSDAMLVLGYISNVGLAGGSVPVFPDLAVQAIADQIAGPMKVDLLQAAHGIYLVAAAVMTRAVKAVTTFRGRDPRDFALIAFGGNGSLMAPEIAANLKIGRIVVPPLPGLFSACGLLVAPTEREIVQSVFLRLEEGIVPKISDVIERLSHATVSELETDGCAPAKISTRCIADLRYSGQAYELSVEMPVGSNRKPDLMSLRRAFDAEHQRTYGHCAPDEPVDIVNIRVIAQEPAPNKSVPHAAHGLDDARKPTDRKLYFGKSPGQMRAEVIDRKELMARGKQYGPLVIEEYDATTLVPPGWSASVDEAMNINLEFTELK